MRAFSNICSEAFKQHFYNFSASKNNATRNEYISYINMLCNHLKKDFLSVDFDDARKYLDHMNNKRADGKLNKKTIAVRLACYNSIAQYIEDKSSTYNNPFSRLPRPEVRNEFDPNRIPSMEDLDKLFSEAKKDSQDFLILALATRVGLSASSILRIDTQNIMDDGKDIYIHFEPKSDFNSDSYIKLPEDVRDILKMHIEQKHIDLKENSSLFKNRRGNPLSIQNVDQLIKRLVTKCNLTEYTLKDFRNRAIMEMAKAGASMEQLENYTGLKSLRLEKFFLNKSLINGTCPAELVNYRLTLK